MPDVTQQLHELLPEALCVEVAEFKSGAERRKYPEGSQVRPCTPAEASSATLLIWKLSAEQKVHCCFRAGVQT